MEAMPLRENDDDAASHPVLIRNAMSATGLSARRLARTIGVDERTMRRWQAGDAPLPGPAVALLRILIAIPEAMAVLR